MHLLTLVAAVAVLSNTISAIPQPSGNIEQIQQKRWGWPWSTDSDSRNGGHGKGGNGGGDNDDDDDDGGDDDDSAAETRSLLPFTHPHLLAEATGTAAAAAAATEISPEISVSGVFSSSVIGSARVTATAIGVSAGAGAGLQNSVSIMTTVTDQILSPTSLLINSTPISTPTPTPTISATLKPTISPLIQNHTSLTLCPANPTSIITITENCTSTYWITVSAGAEWSSMSLPITSSMSLSTSTSLPSSISGVPSAGEI